MPRSWGASATSLRGSSMKWRRRSPVTGTSTLKACREPFETQSTFTQERSPGDKGKQTTLPSSMKRSRGRGHWWTPARERFIDDGSVVCFRLSPGDLSCVNVDCVSNGSLHAFKVEVPVTGDLLRHFMDEPLSDVALAPQLLGIGKDLRFHQQIENGGRQYVIGEIVRAGESAAGIAAHSFEMR